MLGLLFCGTAGAVPIVIGEITPSQNSTVTGTVGATQTFTIPLNETASVIWTENSTSTTIPTGEGNIATLNHVIQTGSYQVTASIDGAGQIASWNVESTPGVPVITLSNPSSSSVSGNVGESRTFTATVEPAADMSWYLNGNFLYTNASVVESSYTNSSAVAGTYTLEVRAQNSNGAAEPKSWTWTVGSSANGVPVEVNPSEGKVEVSQGETRNFYVNSTNSQNIKVEWFVNDETSSRKTQDGVTSSLYEFKESNSGSYTLKAVVTDPSGNYDAVTKTWITVSPNIIQAGTGSGMKALGYPEHIPGMPRVIRASITTLIPECLLKR